MSGFIDFIVFPRSLKNGFELYPRYFPDILHNGGIGAIRWTFIPSYSSIRLPPRSDVITSTSCPSITSPFLIDVINVKNHFYH